MAAIQRVLRKHPVPAQIQILDKTASPPFCPVTKGVRKPTR
jgi:hypothetical protein